MLASIGAGTLSPFESTTVEIMRTSSASFRAPSGSSPRILSDASFVGDIGQKGSGGDDEKVAAAAASGYDAGGEFSNFALFIGEDE